MIAVIDYGMGNLRSVQKALEAAGAAATVTADPAVIRRSEKVVFPGVGSFGDAVKELKRRRLDTAITGAIAEGKPFLGLCLGLQLLFEKSEEAPGVKGLGILPGEVKRFRFPRSRRALKVPHMGWNTITTAGRKRRQRILSGIRDGSYVYFVHSYYVKPRDKKVVLTTTEYGARFVSGVRSGKVYGFRPECVMGGNGSDELLALVARAFVPGRGRIMTMRPTYLVYETVAAGLGAKLVEVPFTREYRLPAALAGKKADIFYLSNPNSPTGTAVWPDEVEAFAKRFRGLVVVDEAYADFARFNCLKLARELPNVLVLRTMSKSFSLAGLRLGLALGPREVISTLMKLKDSYNLSGLQLAAATAALSDMAHVRRNVKRIVRTRERLIRELVARGFLVLPSESNFVMFHLGRRLSRKLGAGPGAVKALRRRGVLVRHYPGAGLRDALRVTVGTEKEIDKFLSALDIVTK